MPDVGISDLDGRALDEYRKLGSAIHRLPSGTLHESNADLIEKLHLRKDGFLRRAALLLFHANPARFFAGAFVKIGYFRTETEIAYQDVVEGNLFVQAARTVDLLHTKYSKAEISYEGIYRRETPLAPGEAIRGAVLNAIAHRDYSIAAPIQIRVYDDRVILWNPAALPPGWTIANLLTAHVSVPHNPRIANAFFRAGMMEAWGQGVEDIIRACRTAGTTRPNWVEEPGWLRLEFLPSGSGGRAASRETDEKSLETPCETGHETIRDDRQPHERSPSIGRSR